jgi:hypothetical protein
MPTAGAVTGPSRAGILRGMAIQHVGGAPLLPQTEASN